LESVLSTLGGLLITFIQGQGKALMDAAQSDSVPPEEVSRTADSVISFLQDIKAVASKRGELYVVSQPKVNEILRSSERGHSQAPPAPANLDLVETASDHGTRQNSLLQWSCHLRSLNQHDTSKAREIEILRILNDAVGSGVRLKDLMEKLQLVALCTAVQRNAVVTQLNRMKNDRHLIISPYEGVYAMAPQASEYLQNRMLAFKNLVVPDAVRRGHSFAVVAGTDVS
jgi:hypothetical protein